MATKMTVKKAVRAPKKPVKKVSRPLRTADGLRLRKLNRKQSRKKSNELLKKEQATKQLPAAWDILLQSCRHLYRHRKTFLGILLIYGIFYVLVIKGISANFQLGNLRKNLSTTFSSKPNSIQSGIALYGLLLGTTGANGTGSAGIYQTALLVLTSLALIWALRVSYAKSAVLRVKDSFYKSTHALIPFLGVAFVLILECLPAVIAGSLFGAVQTSNLTVNTFQKLVVLSILLAATFWTVYMLSSSLFALYIVTLPNAKPLASLRAAKKLVKYRRVIVFRKVLFLPVVLLVSAGIVLIPLIIFFAKGAEVLFLIFTILVLGVIHGYLYTLYRYLINDKHYEQD
jgi:hypothetical protein